MPEAEPDAHGPLWDFALALYGRPNVAEACLALQERHGIDVNLVLACCWCGLRGRPLDAAALEALDREVGGWRHDVVRPLRVVRRALKAPGYPVEAGDREALRAQVEGLELEAERLELEALAARLAEPPGTGASDLAAANLRAYLAASGVGLGPAERAAIALLTGAAG